jgi:hypothetical protein
VLANRHELLVEEGDEEGPNDFRIVEPKSPIPTTQAARLPIDTTNPN